MTQNEFINHLADTYGAYAMKFFNGSVKAVFNGHQLTLSIVDGYFYVSHDESGKKDRIFDTQDKLEAYIKGL